MGHHHIHDIVELDDGFQSHVCFCIGKITRAAGVAILMHPRHKKWAKRKIGKKINRIIAAYAPHAGYSKQDSTYCLKHSTRCVQTWSFGDSWRELMLGNVVNNLQAYVLGLD